MSTWKKFTPLLLYFFTSLLLLITFSFPAFAGSVTPTSGTSVYKGLSGSATGLSDVGGASGAPAKDLPALVGSFIGVLLAILGIILVILVVIAGVKYMTAAGEDQKVKDAKKLLQQAIIGMIIVVSAYAISKYVVEALQKAAGP